MTRPDPSKIRRTVLDNGLTVLSEEIPTVRSASLGIWVKVGSRHESDEESGITHFIEHMLFKGTERRSAREIAVAIDSMGGQLDAFTSKEGACYYAKVLDEHLADALELLSDIVLNPRFDEDDVERERGVILEEIAAAEDDPEDFLYESFVSRFWTGHPLGRPVLGNRQTVGGFTGADLRRHFQVAYDPANLVIAAAGNLDHEAFLEQVRAGFDTLERGSGPPETTPPEPVQHFRIFGREQLEQVHVAVGSVGPSQTDDDRYPGYLLNTVLGGSVSSRLFQSIREEHGLAYSVYSHMAGFRDAGQLYIYAGTRPDAAPFVLGLILEELRTLRRETIPEEELGRAKDHLKGSLMLGLENTAGRMTNLARQEIYFGRGVDLDEILEGIEAVEVADLQRLARKIFADELVSADFVAREPEAERLRQDFAAGVELPGGSVLELEPAGTA